VQLTDNAGLGDIVQSDSLCKQEDYYGLQINTEKKKNKIISKTSGKK